MTQLWNEFVKSVANTNVVNDISCARYWSIILKFAYEKEGIAIPENEETVEFSMFLFTKTVEDDGENFPTVARIPDAMLKKVDATHPMLVKYLQSINPDIITGVLLTPYVGPLKKKKGSKKPVVESPSKPSPSKVEQVVKPKKTKHNEPPPIVVQKPKKESKNTNVSKPLINKASQPEIEVIPSKTRILRRLTKMAHRPSHSLDMSYSFSSKFTTKHHVTSKGFMIREVPVPVSPAS